MSWFKELLSESGNTSMTRFLSMICVLTACFIVVYGMFKGVDLNGIAGICSTFLGFGLGAKVVQKNFEKDGEVSSEVTSEKK